MTSQAEISTEASVRAKLAEAAEYSGRVSISLSSTLRRLVGSGMIVTAYDVPADRYPVQGGLDQLIWIRHLTERDIDRGLVSITVCDVTGDMTLTAMLDILLGVLRSGQEAA